VLAREPAEVEIAMTALQRDYRREQLADLSENDPLRWSADIFRSKEYRRSKVVRRFFYLQKILSIFRDVEPAIHRQGKQPGLDGRSRRFDRDLGLAASRYGCLNVSLAAAKRGAQRHDPQNTH